MTALVLSLVLVALGAIAVLIVLRRRLNAARRTLRSVAKASGSPSTDASLIRDVRSLAHERDDARSEANSYAAALQGAASGIAILNAAGSVRYANPAAHLLLDGSGERAVLRSRVAALGQRVASSGASETIEVSLHDPERRVLGLTAVPLDTESHLGSVCVYFDDLSVRRRVEMMRTDFVANASHELKTPLGALSLLAETLMDARDEETRARLARRLQTEASRMAHVIDDILQLAETESLGVDFSHVSVADVMDEAAKTVHSLAEEQDIELIRGDMVDVAVSGSRDQLISAVRNLLQNAITYTAVKGEPGSVTYASHVADGSVSLEVSDTGIGIPDRYADRVFERFFRVDRARSRESGGTGLGLSIVRNVAVTHGGDIALESKVGTGSTFTMTLPIAGEA